MISYFSVHLSSECSVASSCNNAFVAGSWSFFCGDCRARTTLSFSAGRRRYFHNCIPVVSNPLTRCLFFMLFFFARLSSSVASRPSTPSRLRRPFRPLARRASDECRTPLPGHVTGDRTPSTRTSRWRASTASWKCAAGTLTARAAASAGTRPAWRSGSSGARRTASRSAASIIACDFRQYIKWKRKTSAAGRYVLQASKAFQSNKESHDLLQNCTVRAARSHGVHSGAVQFCCAQNKLFLTYSKSKNISP